MSDCKRFPTGWLCVADCSNPAHDEFLTTPGHDGRAGDLREAVERLAEEFASEVDWSSGRNNYGDNEAWESAARQLRALLAEHQATPAEGVASDPRCCCDRTEACLVVCPVHPTALTEPAEVVANEREALARAWHALSDHAADGTPFGGGLCNCEKQAERVAALTAKAKAEALREAADDAARYPFGGNGHPAFVGWLRERADRSER